MCAVWIILHCIAGTTAPSVQIVFVTLAPAVTISVTEAAIVTVAVAVSFGVHMLIMLVRCG